MLFRTLIAAAFLTSATCDRATAAAPAAAPAEVEAPDLAGLWRFDMISPKGSTTLGAMTVVKDKDSGAYGGKAITNGGGEALPIRSIELRSQRMTMTVDSARGPVVFQGKVDASGQSFSGTLRYHDGRDFAMRGIKQERFGSPAPANR